MGAMELVFGWNLDGLFFPETTSGEKASFNSAIAGPAALLGLLELRLGLRCPPVNRTLRLAEYLKAMRNIHGKHFFSASLATDAWATADYVLSLRDKLLAAGWNKSAIPGLTRIESLAKLEESAQLQDGFGERLALVKRQLDEESSAPFEKLQLTLPISLLPALWQAIIKRLQELGTQILELAIESKCAIVDSDLSKLQKRLSCPDSNERLSLSGDGTVAVLDANDELQAATFVAAWLSHTNPSHKNIVLIRGADCSLLSQACQRYGLPSIGNTARSQLKEALQILPLSFKLACRPVDPINVVEFLRMQQGPVPEWVSRELIAAIAQAPGIDGEEWNKAWQLCLNKQRDWILKDEPALSKDEASFKSKDKLEPHKRWFARRASEGSDSILLSDAIDICNRVEQWATNKCNLLAEKSTYEICAAQSRLLKQLLSMDKTETISLAQLNKMLEAVLSYGVSMTGAEAADWSLVDKPGQIWEKHP